MADNLSGYGVTTQRADITTGGRGKLMRLRGGSVLRGELVQINLSASDGDCTALANLGAVDLGSEDGTTDSTPFGTVIPLAAATEGQILGVALHAAADDAELRVEFGACEFGAIVQMLVEIDTAAVAAGDELVADSTTVTGTVGVGTPGGVGKIIAIALEASAAAAATSSDLITVLFKGVSGFGFRET
jgi:hypothetical protein